MRHAVCHCAGLLAMLMLAGCSVNFDSVNEEQLAEEFRSYEIGKPAFDASDPLLQRRTVLLCGDINFAVAQTVCRQLVYLDTLSTTEPIRLLINSGGGDGTAYMAIANTIQGIHAPVDTVNIGLSASCAAILIQSATGKRYAQADTAFIIHDVKGTPKDLKDIYSDYQEELYRNRCRLPDDWLPLEKEHTFTAQEALKYEFVDAVVDKMDL
jgi:ATP-dependent Clp protease protease subunit